MPERETLTAEWRAMVPDWIARFQAGPTAEREGLLDDWMLRLAGDVAGKRVIDLGCGEGRFSRMLAERGATVVGVDLQPEFIAYAADRAVAGETYLVGDMQRLDGIDDASFDLAISYITLVDVPDMGAAVAAAARVVKPGGKFIVANVSPMATAAINGPWLRADDNSKIHYVLDDYTNEAERTLTLAPGKTVTNFHRMLSTTVNTFISAGFDLLSVHEPTPTAEQLARFPSNDDLYRVPIFTIYELRRSAAE